MALTPPPAAPPAAPSAPGAAPQRADPSTFRSLADSFVVWLVGFRTSIASLVTWLSGYITWAATNVTELSALQTDVATKQATASSAASTASAAASSATSDAAAAVAARNEAVAAVPPMQVADYTALRAYAGASTTVIVTSPSGIAGEFVRDDTDTTSADNGGTIFVASTGKRWKRQYNGGLNPKWFGATLNGVADDTASFNAAIAALPAAGGTIEVPPGIPTLNITLIKPGVRIVGCSQAADRSFTSNYWKPFNVAIPVVQIANDTGIVSGCSLECISFYGNGTGQLGLYLAGGAYRNNFRNVSAHDFTLHNVRLLSGTNPVAFNQFVNGHINASIVGSRGLCAGVGPGGSYCEANGFTNYGIAGPGTSGYAVENDSSNSLFFSNVWVQVQNNCGIKFTKSGSVLPKIRCANVFVDSDASTDAVVEGYNTAIVNLSDLMIGLVEVDGKLKLSDTTLVDGVRTFGAWLPFQTNFSFPMIWGTMKVLNGTGAAAMDPTTFGGSMACSSGNWDFTAALGPMRLASATASGVQLGSDGVYRYQATTASFRPIADDTYDLGSSAQRWRTVLTKTVKHTGLTVATLPGASSSGAGAKAFVTDATATTFASIVAGGGANGVPVYSDGTNWRIG